MNGFKYEPTQVTLPEPPPPEIRKAPPCPTCWWWRYGDCGLVYYRDQKRDFSCYEARK